jgi:hypothetical protein
VSDLDDPALGLDAADHWAEIAREDREKARSILDGDTHVLDGVGGPLAVDGGVASSILDGVDRMIVDHACRWGPLPLALLAVLHQTICGHRADPRHLRTLRWSLGTSRALLATEFGDEFALAIEELVRVARPEQTA